MRSVPSWTTRSATWIYVEAKRGLRVLIFLFHIRVVAVNSYSVYERSDTHKINESAVFTVFVQQRRESVSSLRRASKVRTDNHSICPTRFTMIHPMNVYPRMSYTETSRCSGCNVIHAPFNWDSFCRRTFAVSYLRRIWLSDACCGRRRCNIIISVLPYAPPSPAPSSPSRDYCVFS
ncbi:hypothetical protein EVAR_50084_1 [Eumeta japonica]|uniref:Uncharacterized protein n=1 Tax=Eumeta variegata TaxID=151549 RepID=A0A4C1ZMH6_EUMVA|nr:hypothetical protein EVAR_50084_1 [Eumeta japonica]